MATRSALLLGLLAAISGCAMFDGNLGAIPILPSPPPMTVAPVAVTFEKPVVVVQDSDFEPLAATFATSLQKEMADFACRRGAFTTCTDQPDENAYRVATRVTVEDFRQARGGVVTLLGALVLPPLLGALWSVPVGAGTCTWRLEWTLFDPAGAPIAKDEAQPGYGFGWCQGADGVGEALSKPLDRFLKKASRNLAARLAKPPRASQLARLPPPVVEAPVAVPAATPQPTVKVDIALVDLALLATPVLRLAVPKIAVPAALADNADMLTDIITTEAARSGIKVIGSSDIESLLGFERQRDLLDCSDDISCVAEIGGALGVDAVLVAAIGRLGDTYVMNAKVIDIRKAVVLTRTTGRLRGNPDALVDLAEQTTRAVVLPLVGK